MYIEYYANDGSLRYLGDANELYHYNHNHDALGRFSKSVGRVSSRQVSSPGQYSRKANKLEKMSSEGRAKALKKEYKAKKLSAKGKKAAARLQEAQAKKYRDIASKAGNAAKKTAGEAFAKKHYTISEKVYERNTENAKDWAVAAGIGLLMPAPRAVRLGTYLAYDAASDRRSSSKYGTKKGSNAGEHPRGMYTKKYKVKKTKNGTRSSYTSANRGVKVTETGQTITNLYTTTTKTGEVVNRKKKRK